MLRHRVLTAVVGIPALVLVLYLGGVWLQAVALLLALVAQVEYTRLWAARGVRLPWLLGALLTTAVVLWCGGLAITMSGPGPGLALLLFAMLVVTLSYQVLRFEQMDFTAAAALVFGALYIGLGFGFLTLLRRVAYLAAADPPWWGLAPLALAFFCTWAADSTAYLVGVRVGRHKIAPKVSPGKSWEGSLAGFLAGALVGAAMAPLLGWSRGLGGLAGVLLAVVGLFGDLAESSLKRQAGVKDSGSILPGHGGILDRFDSSLFVLPTSFYMVLLLPRTLTLAARLLAEVLR